MRVGGDGRGNRKWSRKDTDRQTDSRLTGDEKMAPVCLFTGVVCGNVGAAAAAAPAGQCVP